MIPVHVFFVLGTFSWSPIHRGSALTVRATKLVQNCWFRILARFCFSPPSSQMTRNLSNVLSKTQDFTSSIFLSSTLPLVYGGFCSEHCPLFVKWHVFSAHLCICVLDTFLPFVWLFVGVTGQDAGTIGCTKLRDGEEAEERIKVLGQYCVNEKKNSNAICSWIRFTPNWGNVLFVFDAAKQHKNCVFLFSSSKGGDAVLFTDTKRWTSGNSRRGKPHPEEGWWKWYSLQGGFRLTLFSHQGGIGCKKECEFMCIGWIQTNGTHAKHWETNVFRKMFSLQCKLNCCKFTAKSLLSLQQTWSGLPVSPAYSKGKPGHLEDLFPLRKSQGEWVFW